MELHGAHFMRVAYMKKYMQFEYKMLIMNLKYKIYNNHIDNMRKKKQKQQGAQLILVPGKFQSNRITVKSNPGNPKKSSQLPTRRENFKPTGNKK